MKKPVPTSGADPAGTTEQEQVDILVGELGEWAQPDPVALQPSLKEAGTVNVRDTWVLQVELGWDRKL
jgi:hypothetical protein